MTSPRPYQVCLYVGANTPVLPEVRVVDLTPHAPTAQAVLDKLRASDLNPSDLRSRVLFVTDAAGEHHRAALLTYAALLGFAKRRLDVAFGTDADAIDMAAFDASMRSQRDAGRPETPIAQAQVGGPARTDMLYVDLASFTPEKLSVLRYARRLRFVPPAVIAHALPQLVALAAVRARGDSDRLPVLCDGTEPLALPDGTEPGIDLDALRRDAEEIRRASRTDNRDAFADKVELSARQSRLLAADSVDIRTVLTRLGTISKTVMIDPKPGTPEHEAGTPVPAEVWHCPRPERHTNGDATPSSRVHDKTGTFRCFRCDRERVGPLRLVMDVNGMTADEAADWLLTI
jgi:hypothetical protein